MSFSSASTARKTFCSGWHVRTSKRTTIQKWLKRRPDLSTRTTSPSYHPKRYCLRAIYSDAIRRYIVCVCAHLHAGSSLLNLLHRPTGYSGLSLQAYTRTICEETNSIRYSPLCCAILTYFIRRFHLTALRTRRTEPIRVSVYESSSRRSIVKMPNV